MDKGAGIGRKILVWAAIIIGAAATIAIAVAFLGPISDAVASHDVHTVPATARPEQLRIELDAVRGMFLQTAAGLLAFGAFVYTARNFTLSRRAHELSAEGQVTDRYTRAIDQLGSGKSDIRIGGIYALERTAWDSVRDHGVIMDVLAAFIRRKTLRGGHPSDDWPSADVRAAMTVIARRNVSADRHPIDLHDANLRGIKLDEMELKDAMLRNIVLEDVQMVNVNLGNANLTSANLQNANMDGADLTGADLTGADLTGADLTGVNLDGADLTGANLDDATLTGVHMVGAKLKNIVLRGAVLAGVDFSGADFSGGTLTQINFSGAKLPGANLSATDLTGANFTDAVLTRCNMSNARAYEAIFTRANLSATVFTGTDLHGVDLTTLRLAGLDLTGAKVAPDTRLPGGWQVEIQGPDSAVLKRVGL